MRILMLTLDPWVRGPLPKIARALVPALEEQGIIVDQARWGRHSDKESLLSKILGRAQDIWQICKALRRVPYDGCFLFCTTHDLPALLRDIPLVGACRLLRTPVLCMFHGSDCARLHGRGDRFFKLLTRLLLSGCDVFLLLSSEELHQWREFSPSKRWYLVTNPFVPNRVVTASRPLNLDARSTAKPAFLFIGRLIKEKGVLDMLSAFRLVRNEMECKLTILGSGILADQVRALIVGSGLTSDVTFSGYLEGDALAQAYSSATVFCLPTYFGEGFPTVIAEAMAAGLPVITTKVRGAADHLVEGVNGLFVPPRDPQALASAMLKLAQDNALRERMGAANVTKVRDFAPEVVVKNYVAALEDAFSRTPAETGLSPAIKS